MWRWLVCLALVTTLARADSLPSPVQSVNGQIGVVTLPTYQRQVSPALAVPTSNGQVAWTFPDAFANTPTCFTSLTATDASYVFDAPLITSMSLTAVSVAVSAHPKQLTIASLALPILLQITPNGPPVGTTITLSCFAPM